jgi:hypothetical protein
MAESNVPPTLIRGTNNTGNASQNAGYTPSRLLLYTNSLRNDLQSRNLYTPNNIYPITVKSQAQNIINAVNGIASIIAPFKSYDLSNTVYGRLITTQTPLTTIGLAMLGKQFAMNAGSHIAQQNFPTIKLANLFDGDKNTHLFTKNINFKITKKEGVTNFQQFLDAVTFFDPSRHNPFKGSKKTNINAIPIENNPLIQNSYYIQETNSGQITFLFNALNQNIYKQGFGSTATDKALQNAATDAQTKFYERNQLIGSYDSPQNKYQKYFNFFNTNPYSNLFILGINPFTTVNGQAVVDMNVLAENTNPTQEYAPDKTFIELNFGQTNKNNTGSGQKLNQDANNWINEGDEFGDAQANKIVWGRDSINDARWNTDARGSFGGVNKEVAPNVNLEDFNVYSGILAYTRNLLNASQGAIADMTRKAFTNKSKDVQGFNGSALWVSNNLDYAQYSGWDAESGVRQHSALDQYDRFAKAIRFNGNWTYVGNENSVIYDRVLPRIHPTMNTDKTVNNKNLMFSIENLAVRVISKDGVGIIDDEFGSPIPVCEVGPFNGRQMWFPPYNLELNETSSAKFEETVMVGRNEPMYNYMYTTRAATLTFTLLVDYPEQLKRATYQGADKHRVISEFFAFGGDTLNPTPVIINPQHKIKVNIDHQYTITGPTDTAEPQDLSSPVISASFPNDFPKEAEVSGAFDTMYKSYQYEIAPGCQEASGKISSVGMNQFIYVVSGLTGKASNKTLHLDPSFSASQYNLTSEKSQLNAELLRIFGNVANRHYYYVNIKGGASKLYTEQNPNDVKEEQDYNKKLGLRRAEAAKKLVEARIKALFGQSATNLGIEIVLDVSTTSLTGAAGTTGSALAKQDNATKAAINKDETKKERYAEIQIKRNSNTPIKKINGIGLVDMQAVAQLTQDNLALTKVAKQNDNAASHCIMEERKGDVQTDSGDGAILSGFQAIEGNYYYPVFHTQTPEDFHKRLTFLQQCTRQGAAKHIQQVNENGILRAKNSVFGRQPICILRVGDFFYTKVIIENLTIDYSETTWDMNPEGFGMQPMLAKVTLQLKVLGGQSLKGPIDALQNAVTFNYYANSNFTSNGLYARPSAEADNQEKYINGILAKESNALSDAYDKKFPPKPQ